MTEPVVPVTQVVTPAVEPAPQSVVVDPAPAQDEAFDAERAKALIDKLRSEVKALKPFEKKALELAEAEKKREESEMTELQKAQKRIEELEQKTKAAERREMQRTAAEKFKLPSAIAELIPGDTIEAIEAKAAELAKALPKATPNLSPNNPGVDNNAQETREQKKQRLLGQNVDVFAAGGGVHFPDQP